jgi:hypothetical protein
MDRTDYVNAVNTVQIAAGLLTTLDLAEVLNCMERADALGPILDPTLYKDASERMDAQRRLIQAALPLQAEMRRQFAAAGMRKAG